MSVVVLPHDQEKQAPGSWWRSGSGYISIRCPQCMRAATLRDPLDGPARADGTHGHSIEADGTVRPSIVCPSHRTEPPCSWHVWGRLDAWNP